MLDKTIVRNKILEYASQEMQTNAVLFNEHAEWVTTVITLIRDDYHAQAKAGADEFVLSSDIQTYLDNNKPWEDA
jgi:hypothetical protein